MASLSTYFKHTWYKNRIDLRCRASAWAGWGSWTREEAPILRVARRFSERIWSIPTLVNQTSIVFGCYDHRVHCVGLSALEDRWEFVMNAPIYSSCALLADHSVVVGSEDRSLVRLSSDGDLIWRFYGEGGFHCSPTMDHAHGVVYAGCIVGSHFYAIDAALGKLSWERQMHPSVVDDICSSAALADRGAVIVGTGNQCVCFEADGTIRFRVDTEAQVEATAAVDNALGIGLIGSYDHRIYRFSTLTGETLSIYPTQDKVNSAPAIAPNGIAGIGSDDGFFYGIHLQEGDIVWKTDVKSPARWTPVSVTPIGDFLIIGSDGVLRLLNADTGSIFWELAPAWGIHSAPLITPDGEIVIGSHDGTLNVFRWY